MRRFLLDQNFPLPPFAPSAVDATVEYQALVEFDVTLTQRQTPDWLIILRAAASGQFDGIVTRDSSQLDQPEEMVAVMRTDLSIITWRKKIDDATAIWGHLIAFMPIIQQRIEQDGPRVFLLPRPALRQDNVLKASKELGRLANEQNRSTAEIRDRALAVMRDELETRDLADLREWLDG